MKKIKGEADWFSILFFGGLGVFLLLLVWAFINQTKEECIHGVLYGISHGYSTSRIVLVDKDGKPLTCEDKQ